MAHITDLAGQVDGANGQANRTSYSVPAFINGEEVHPEKRFDVVSPATGEVVHQCGAATATEVQAAVDSASKAFQTWRNVIPKKRRDIFLKAAEIMERRKEELIGYMMAETGASRMWAEFNIKVSKDLIIDVAGRLPTLEGTFPATEDENTGALVLREPYGVVLAIAPWFGCRLTKALHRRS
jgi:acyl-CoA reductase-like NAD-dependent aldehyde dehydrogenase